MVDIRAKNIEEIRAYKNVRAKLGHLVTTNHKEKLETNHGVRTVVA